MSEIKLVTVAGKHALAELDRLRAEYATTGLYPILLGDAEDYSRVRDGIAEEGVDPAATLKDSEAIDPVRWFRERTETDPELYQDEEGEWPDSAGEEMGIITHLGILSRKPKKEVLIGL